MDTKIFCFYANVKMLEQEDVFRHFFCRLSEERRRKIEAARDGGSRRCSLGAWTLMDYGLHVLYGLRERDAAIAYGAHGKPYLPGQPRIHFNLSHSGDYALAAFAPVELGCDIQQAGQDGRRGQTAQEQRCRRIAARFFAEEEQRALAEGMDFYRIWARKESYLKLTGDGMALDMRSFSVVLDTLESPGGRCHFADWELPGGGPADDEPAGYALSVCYASAELFPVVWTETDLRG